MFIRQRCGLLIPMMVGVVCVSIFLIGASGSAEIIKLRLWHHWGGARVPLMKEQISRFEAKYPNIDVDDVLQPGGARLEKLLTAIVGGQPPDVSMLGREDIPSFVLKHTLIPLDEYMEKDNIDQNMFYESEYRSCVYQGKTWILPLPTGGATGFLYYNKGMFRGLGLDPNRPPQTWKELEEISKKFTVIENGRIRSLGVNVIPANPMRDFLHWVFSNNGVGKYLSPDGRKVLLDCPEVTDTLSWMVEFTDDIYGGIEKVSGFASMAAEALGGGPTPFLNNAQAMELSGSWNLLYIREHAPKMDFGIALWPHAEGAETHTAVPGGWGYVALKGGEHPYESWLLVKWLTCEEEGAGWFTLQQARPSPVKKFNENPKYWEVNPYWDVVLEALKRDVGISQPVVARTIIGDIFRDMVEMAMYHKKTPEEAVKWAAENIQKSIDDALVEYGLE